MIAAWRLGFLDMLGKKRKQRETEEKVDEAVRQNTEAVNRASRALDQHADDVRAICGPRPQRPVQKLSYPSRAASSG